MLNSYFITIYLHLFLFLVSHVHNKKYNIYILCTARLKNTVEVHKLVMICIHIITMMFTLKRFVKQLKEQTNQQKTQGLHVQTFITCHVYITIPFNPHPP